MNEKLIEKKLREEVRHMEGLAIKLSSSYYTGIPDRLILLPEGRARFVEVKTTGKKPTPRQLKVHDELRKLGFNVEVIDDEISLNNFLKTLGR
jgi:hypothetical protein